MLLYAAEGDVWTYSSRITYSFVPDGTKVGGVPSNLFSTFNALYTTPTWESQFQNAAAEWQTSANLNLAQVSDDGRALGSNGDQQGDPGIGDIRIAMIPMGLNGTLAFTILPPPANGGTEAGDIVFNSSYGWGINNGQYDIMTVALHEFGHALGLAHSTSTSAAMYPYYQGVNEYLTTDDVNGLASLYGTPSSARPANYSFATATNVNNARMNNQVMIPEAVPDSGYDTWYQVSAPTNTTSTVTVTMQASNLSSLSPWLGVYNVKDQLLGKASSVVTGSNVTVTLTGILPGQNLWIDTNSADNSFGWDGAYGLLINFNTSTGISAVAPPNTVVPWQSDQGGGSTNIQIGAGGDTVSVGLDPVSVVLGNDPTTPTSTSSSAVTVTPTSTRIDTPDVLQIGATTLLGDALTTSSRRHERHVVANALTVETRRLSHLEQATRTEVRQRAHDAALAHMNGDGHSLAVIATTHALARRERSRR